MAKIKSDPKNSAKEKTLMIKIVGQVGHFAGELAAGKDHLIEMAGDAIASVKSTINNFTAKKSASPKNTIKNKTKKAVAKTARPAAKKAVITPIPKKALSASATKKTSPPKKVAPRKPIPTASKKGPVKK